MDAVLLAVVVGVMSIATLIVNARIAASSQRSLYARQDQVERNAADQAERVVAANRATTVAVETQGAVTHEKLEVITEVANVTHDLVNSAFTDAKASELDAKIALLVLLKRDLARDEEAGRKPDQEAISTVKETTTKIVELKKIIADRLAATDAAAVRVKEQSL